MTTTYSAPFALQWAGSLAQPVSLTAGATSAPVTLQAPDSTGSTPGQVWVLGSDGRIYPQDDRQGEACLAVVNEVADNGTVYLAPVSDSDPSQLWNLDAILGTDSPATVLNAGLGQLVSMEILLTAASQGSNAVVVAPATLGDSQLWVRLAVGSTVRAGS